MESEGSTPELFGLREEDVSVEKESERERESLLYIHNRFLLVGNCFSEKIEDHDNGMDLSFWIDYVMKRPFLA